MFTGRKLLPIFIESGECLQVNKTAVDTSLASPKAVNELIEAHGFTFRRSLGQNFLIDGNILRSIVHIADINQTDTVVEIGAGIGTLTRALASLAKRVFALEIDQRLNPVLADTVAQYDNVELHNADALEMDWQAFWLEHNLGKVKLVANLPYYITSPLLINLFEAELPLEKMVVMMQREVAERLVAEPGTKAYGTISVLANYYSDVKVCQIVPPTVFMPRPAVDSAVVMFTINHNKHETVDGALLWQVIKAGFAQRRKTLINSMASASPFKGSIEKTELRSLLESSGIEPDVRAERLNVDDFVTLTSRLATMSGVSNQEKGWSNERQ